MAQGVGGAVVAGAFEMAEEQKAAQALIDQGSLKLPDGAKCKSKLGTDPDPVAVFWCHIASDLADKPDGTMAQNVKAANEEIARKDINGKHIRGFFTYTRQIKTFHPRSRGMLAYRDAIIETINRVQPASSSMSGGTCSLRLSEVRTCDGMVYGNVDVKGANGQQAYHVGEPEEEPGVQMTEGSLLFINNVPGLS